MILFEGKYSWPGERKTYSKPVSWWPGCYWLKIIDLSIALPSIYHLKPYLCLIADMGEGVGIGSKFQNLAESICEKFSLEIKRVLWVEYSPQYGKGMKVATLKPETVIGGRTLYSVTWRPVMPNEMEMISGYV